jgi:hypothetical protein
MTSAHICVYAITRFCRESRGYHPGVGRDPSGRRAAHQPRGRDVGQHGAQVRQAARARPLAAADGDVHRVDGAPGPVAAGPLRGRQLRVNGLSTIRPTWSRATPACPLQGDSRARESEVLPGCRV